MIERIPDQIPVQTGEWHGTTFDIIPKETFAMACRKINELVDAVNGILDYAPLEMAMKAEHAENNQSPITLIDIFNEMGRLYAGLWNKMEDIHYDLKNKGGDNE